MDHFSGKPMTADDPNLPEAAKAAIKALLSIARTVILLEGGQGNETVKPGHVLAFRVIEQAYTGGDKADSVALLGTVTPEERHQAASIFSLLAQFGTQALQTVTAASVKANDNFVHSEDGKTGSLWLGDGPIPESAQIAHIHGPDCIPPQVGLLKGLLESMGMEIEAQVVDEETFENLKNMGKGGMIRLQDDYEDDPIKQIAKRLEKMPGSKRPKLPPKKLPEC